MIDWLIDLLNCNSIKVPVDYKALTAVRIIEKALRSGFSDSDQKRARYNVCQYDRPWKDDNLQHLQDIA